MSALDQLVCDLPPAYTYLGESETGRRQWINRDLGIFVLAEPSPVVTDAADLADAANWVLGKTLGRYSVELNGRAQPLGRVPVRGAEEGRAARVQFQSETGELTNGIVVVALASADTGVVVNVVWSAIAPDETGAAAIEAAQTVSLATGGRSTV